MLARFMDRGRLGLAALALLVGAGCGDTGNVYWFTGRVYDGATGTRLTGYSVTLQYRDVTQTGDVDEQGRYVLGPLYPSADYSVIVAANGYRTFMSHNMMRTSPGVASQTFYYDAYVYPGNAVVPATNVLVTLGDVPTPPADGVVRMQPTSHPSLTQPGVNTPPGVATATGAEQQIWENDEDLQFRAVSRPIRTGVATFEPGTLVFGVAYQWTIEGVSGHQNLSGTFTAGVDAQVAATVQPYNAANLAVAFHSASLNAIVPTGELVVVMNQPVEFDPTVIPARMVEAVDTGLSITSPDANANGMLNTLRSDSNANDHNVSIAIAGNRITFTWDRNTALATADADDPIVAVTYNNLSEVRLQPVGNRDPRAVRNLNELVGGRGLSVRMAAQ